MAREESISTTFDDNGVPQDTVVDTGEETNNTGLEAGNDLDIEVVDDTPAVDRNRKPLNHDPDVSEDELASYSEGVKKRITDLKRGYHDERRAKEAAERREQEAIRYAAMVMEENNGLRQSLANGEKMFLETLAGKVSGDLESAKRELKDAHERGDSDAIAAAQEKLSRVTYEIESWRRYQPQYQEPIQQRQMPLQQNALQEQNNGYNHQQAVQPQAPQDERAIEWAKRNPWFGQDSAMTGFAFGLHQKLVNSGIDPRSDEYYEHIDSQMRETFPKAFVESNSTRQNSGNKRTGTVVAPASRSSGGGNKVKLTTSQVAIARKLGVPLEEYAKQVMKETRNG